MIISDNKKIKVQNYGLYAISANKVVIVKGKTIVLADPSDPEIYIHPLAITLQYFEIGSYGEVLLAGTLDNIDTTIYSDYVNTSLYLAANGGISSTASAVTIGSISKLANTGSVYINFIVEPSVSWGNISGTLSDQTDLQDVLDTKFDLKDINPVCKLSENINKGQAVYISGATGTNMIISKASNDTESTSSKTFGILSATGITNDQIKIITSGFLEGVNTSTATIGDFIWLGTNGDLIFWHYPQTTKPVAPAHLVFLGIVTRVHAVNGEIFVKVQNGYELDELHDVAVGDYVNRDVLYRDTDNNLWRNGSLFDLMGAASDAQDGYLKASDWTIFNDKQNAITLTTTGTFGEATFDGTTLNIPQYSGGSGGVLVYAKNSTTYSSTGTGSQIIHSLLIPANTFAAGDTVRVTARFKKVGTATTQSNITINTSASLSGATVIKANVFATGTLAATVQGSAVIINSTSNTQLAWTATNLGTSELVNSTSAWQESISINWTANQYIMFSGNPSGTDVLSVIHYMIEKL